MDLVAASSRAPVLTHIMGGRSLPSLDGSDQEWAAAFDALQHGIRSLEIALPAGEWLDYWRPTRTYFGLRTIDYDVPLGREPLCARAPDPAPLASTNSLGSAGQYA